MSQVHEDMSDRASKWRRGGIWVLRLVVAGVLLAAAAPKLADPVAFAAKLPNYRLFPDVLVNVVATTAPMLELLAALALLSGRLYRGGVWLAVGLMATFTALIGSALARGSTSTAAASATPSRPSRSAPSTSCATSCSSASPSCWRSTSGVSRRGEELHAPGRVSGSPRGRECRRARVVDTRR
ncbi:MauE/DoxX family redox-associated membrane protein [Nannocystis pusilla]|uniref:MauE/DoxX family redox-associated membrane protein n=1 Tax=Nannocystis pusilla TaxID=889268 RepID=UPI003B8072FD